MLLNYLIWIYGIVFVLPLTFGATLLDNYGFAYVLMLISFLFVLWVDRRGRSYTPQWRSDKWISRPWALIFFFLIMTSLLSYLFIFYGYTGLVSRDLVRADTRNFNFAGTDFIRVQLGFINIAVAAWIIHYGLRRRHLVYLAIGIALATYILANSGTRWHWLLAVSPLAVYILRTLRPALVFFLSIPFMLAMLAISAVRGSGESLSLSTAAVWDIPAFQSLFVITSVEAEAGDLLDFVNGQILVLIPRFFWPAKPIDEATTSFMIRVIGDSFYGGATVMPGFLGSAWLYGGFLGVGVFSILLGMGAGHVGRKAQELELGSSAFGVAAMAYFGVLLQIRGISIFYFVPIAYFMLIEVLVRQAKLSLLRT